MIIDANGNNVNTSAPGVIDEVVHKTKALAGRIDNNVVQAVQTNPRLAGYGLMATATTTLVGSLVELFSW